MKIGLWDVDGHNYPNLALMKISAWHKAQGDEVSMIEFPTLEYYDKAYVSKVFGDEYSKMPDEYLNADEIVYGGTGFAITVENGKEVYHKELDKPLPYEIEHMYPDYSLYPELTKDTAYGFLTRGCCNNCSFCIVSKKEGLCSTKVADLSEFWRGQKKIELLDPNLLACKDRLDLLNQLAESKAKVNFNQGLDARFITEETAKALAKVNISTVHFAFDFMKNEAAIIKGLQTFQKYCPVDSRNATVYICLRTTIPRLKKTFIESKRFKNADSSRMFVCIESKPPPVQYGICRGGAITVSFTVPANWRTMRRGKTGKHLKNYIWERSKNDRKRLDNSRPPQGKCGTEGACAGVDFC